MSAATYPTTCRHIPGRVNPQTGSHLVSAVSPSENVNVISVGPCNLQCRCINLRLQVNYTAFWWWCITHRSTTFLDLYIDQCV